MKDRIKYKGFIGSVHYASEDRVFYGKVEGVNDLITFEGSTVNELEEGFKYMVDEVEFKKKIRKEIIKAGIARVMTEKALNSK